MSSSRLRGCELLAAFAAIGTWRSRPTLELLLDDAEPRALGLIELDCRRVAPDHFGELDVIAHRRRDQDLAAFVVIGDHSSHVGHIAAVILEVQAAGADDSSRESNTHREDQVSELMDEQVRIHPTAEVPVAAPLGVLGPVERHVGGKTEVGPQEHLPIDSPGVHVLGELVITPLAAVTVAVVAGLALHHVADLALGDHLVGQTPAGVGG